MKISKYLPIQLILLYFVIVYFLFIWGPWPWRVDNILEITLYLVMCHVMLYLGYMTSIKKKRVYKIISKKYIININFNRWFNILVLINFVLVIQIFLSRSGLSLNFFSIWDTILNGFTNPGELYYKKLTQYEEGSSYIMILIGVLSTLLKFLIIPNLIFYWRKWSRLSRILAVLTLIIETLSWVTIGTNKGIFDNVLLLIFALFFKYLFQIKKLSLKMFFIPTVSLLFAFIYFSNAITSRIGKMDGYNKFADIHVDKESVFLKYSPEILDNFWIIMSSYLTQGYYGLSLAFKEDFTTTYGFGNSWFLMNIFDLFSDKTLLEERSYIFKIVEYGWQPYSNWHSFYTWLASDYTFFGVIILMFLLGKIYANLVNDLENNGNLFSKSLLIMFAIMFMYFPANNQIFAFPDTFITFWILFGLWLLNSKFKIIKFNEVDRNELSKSSNNRKYSFQSHK